MGAPPVVVLLGALFAVPSASRSVVVSDGAGLQRALRAAQPGTRILVAPGEYRGLLSAAGLQGTPEQPIVVEAADPARPPVLRGRKECVHLSDVSYVVLRRLVLAGAGLNALNIDDGHTLDTPAHHVVLDGLIIRPIEQPGNRDAIKLSGVDDFLIRGCHIERWGSGGSGIDMYGCHRGLILDCDLRHGNDEGATGIQAKGGSADIVVHRCRLRSAGQRAINLGGTASQFLRPPSATCQARRVVAVGNVLTGSKAAIAFVGSEQCVAAYNTIYRPTAWVARILRETELPQLVPCRSGEFRSNLVVWRWRELRSTVDIRGRTAPATFRFAGNWWFCEDRPSRSRPYLPVPDHNGIFGQDPRLRIDGATIAADAAPDHGAHSRRAAEEFAKLAAELAPWAYETFQKARTADASPHGPAGSPAAP